MPFSIYIIFGLAPSIIWLLFYLRKDSHPESNRMVLKIFFYGMLAALPAVFLEIGFKSELEKLNIPQVISQIKIEMTGRYSTKCIHENVSHIPFKIYSIINMFTRFTRTTKANPLHLKQRGNKTAIQVTYHI